MRGSPQSLRAWGREAHGPWLPPILCSRPAVYPRPPGRSSPATPSPVPGCAPSLPTTLRGSLLLHNNTPPRARSPAPPIAHLSSRLASPLPSRPASEPPLLPTPVPLIPPHPQPHQLTGLPGSLSPHYPASLPREPDPLKGPFIHWRAVCLLPAWGSRPLSLPGPEQELLGGHTVSKWTRGVDVRLCGEALGLRGCGQRGLCSGGAPLKGGGARGPPHPLPLLGGRPKFCLLLRFQPPPPPVLQLGPGPEPLGTGLSSHDDACFGGEVTPGRAHAQASVPGPTVFCPQLRPGREGHMHTPRPQQRPRPPPLPVQAGCLVGLNLQEDSAS